ncbi:hypothetical protein GCM10023084_17450 [Streptomyces lacrimifluminis]|uniref:DUF397 domain-containing protein n=1 Tax=Streptomyces lacrimifluminis TaxID=1500077 RepID=A0A917KD01_9ACTN|nr:DUF397 domain-containing protein [Streptomyces lacrimifluminis]GGJ08848.1 hypothetical protein GCM10012282_01820 [Streptomyces lacrimifluminis]
MKHDLSGAVWRKSSYSGGETQCVEIADGFSGIVPVRDSKDLTGPRLVFETDAWNSFLRTVKTGVLPSL